MEKSVLKFEGWLMEFEGWLVQFDSKKGHHKTQSNPISYSRAWLTMTRCCIELMKLSIWSEQRVMQKIWRKCSTKTCWSLKTGKRELSYNYFKFIQLLRKEHSTKEIKKFVDKFYEEIGDEDSKDSRVEVPEQISAEQRCFRDFKSFSADQRCFRMG